MTSVGFEGEGVRDGEQQKPPLERAARVASSGLEHDLGTGALVSVNGGADANHGPVSSRAEELVEVDSDLGTVRHTLTNYWKPCAVFQRRWRWMCLSY